MSMNNYEQYQYLYRYYLAMLREEFTLTRASLVQHYYRQMERIAYA